MAGRMKKEGLEARARQVAMHVAGALGLTVEGILRGQTSKGATGRHICFYVLHSACGKSLGQTALAFGVDRSTVAQACRAIEDKRDDAAFDDWMTALERSAATAPLPAEPDHPSASLRAGMR